MSADCMQNLCFVETSQELEPKKRFRGDFAMVKWKSLTEKWVKLNREAIAAANVIRV